MAIALIIALLIGGGTSFAAEGAAPGDVLYPVKVSFNEEARSLVAVSNEAQADWDVRLAERRLEEAEKLAMEGKLSAEASASIESRFEDHVKAFRDRAEKIEAKQGSESSFEVNSNFEASLRAHERVLAQIASEKAEMRSEVEPILEGIRARLSVATEARADAEANMSGEASASFKAAAEGKLKAAENKISEVRDFLTRVKSSVSADAYAQAEARLNVAESVVARGKIETEAQTYGKAFASFQEAIRTAQEVKLLVATEERIDLKVNVSSAGTGSNSAQGGPSGASLGASLQTDLKIGNSSAESEGKLKMNLGL